MIKRKRKIVTLTVVLGFYLVSYVVLSFTGGYRLLMSGRARPIGLALDDTFVWQPRFGTCYPFHTVTGEDTHHMDILGIFYFPLISLDQRFVHQSHPYITFPEGDLDQAQFHAWPPTKQMHPTDRRMIAATEAARERHLAELDAARERKDSAEVSRIRKQIREEAQKELEAK